MNVAGLLAAAALWGAAMTVASAAIADTDGVDADVASAVVLEDRYPRPVVDFQGNVASYPDLVYSVPPGFRPLRLDLYRPKQASKDLAGFPLVVYVHGGGWQSGHTRHAGAFANWPGAELMVIPGVDHSFIGVSEAETRKASLAALSKTFSFIDTTLKERRP